MNSMTTLLIDIEHPGLPEALHLMCGRDFSLLRTDSTGRDIYGFSHNDKEYLLMPFSFEAHAHNALTMHLPGMYREWFEDMRLDGARILFASPCGEPLFGILPEEYRSGSGILGIDEHGKLRVTMDRVEHCAQRESDGRGESQQQADAECAAPCACGHEHGGHEHADQPTHEHAHHQHEEALRFQVSLSDQELAHTIRKRVEGLNLLLRQAAASGLEVDISITPPGNAENDEAQCCSLLLVRRITRPL